MALRGDFVGLREAIVRIKKASAAVPAIAKAAAPALEQTMREQFAAQQNPYGTAWKPLAPATVKRWGSHSILSLTGAMDAGTRAEPTDTSVVMTSPPPAFLHQYGWRRRLRKPKKKTELLGYEGGTDDHRGKAVRRVVAMITHGTGGPARPIFPDGRVPNKWRQLIRKIARETVTGKGP